MGSYRSVVPLHLVLERGTCKVVQYGDSHACGKLLHDFENSRSSCKKLPGES